MQPFRKMTATAAPLMIANLDTDQILPKQFLKTITRSGLGRGLFYDFRFRPDGSEIADFILNRPAYANAGILIVSENFGCGSSREHAPWALLDFGIRCVIAPSFAEIFYNNCFNNGLLPIILPKAAVEALAARAENDCTAIAIDLPAQVITAVSNQPIYFAIDARLKRKLLLGLDAIGETLSRNAEIDSFEMDRAARGIAA